MHNSVMITWAAGGGSGRGHRGDNYGNFKLN